MFGIKFIYLLIGAHAGFGELAGLFFLWALVEVINDAPRGLERAKTAALWGIVFAFVSWISAGYYYTQHYGSIVKPLILAGPIPWAHLVMLETKEHVFIFIPVLALAGYRAVKGLGTDNGKQLQAATKWLLGLIALLCFVMAGMGYFVSLAVRLSSGGAA